LCPGSDDGFREPRRVDKAAAGFAMDTLNRSPLIRLEIGRDELHDARSRDLVLIVEFASVAALRTYQRHPQRRAVMNFNEPFRGE
jgi:hypothetical protein